jgi:hypothetical protein
MEKVVRYPGDIYTKTYFGEVLLQQLATGQIHGQEVVLSPMAYRRQLPVGPFF